MKTTFKKALAAISAAAVVGACAALMVTPASAESGTVTIGTVEMTLAELQAANYQVTVPLTFSTTVEQYGLGINYDSNLDYVDGAASASGFDISTSVANHDKNFAVATGASTAGTSNGLVNLVFTVPSDAAEGDSYSLTGAAKMLDDSDCIYNDGIPTYVDGAINIIAEPTEPPTATPTTTPAASPQTGDSNSAPVVGVAVAVAVIGGVALFSKKRK